MAAPAFQPSLDDLGTPLHQVTFVVVDLETTGGSPEACRITEIGAVKTRGGEVVGELHALVDPGVPIPPAISALTGITQAMVADRPPISAILPSFLEFAAGTVVVAHNARFDVSFLNANLTRLSYRPLGNAVVCTAALARRLVRDEVRNCRLATLANFFRCRTEPTHRALIDARATVEVFHGLLERAGSFGVVTLDDLIAFARLRNTPLFKARRHLADGLPSAPGVYAFRSASGEVLYVGMATDLRARVRAYFGNDDRRKITALLKEAAAVDHWPCATPLEAAVRELRLLHEHRPRFNRHQTRPQKAVWLRLTDERFPRLSIVRTPPAGGPALGPLPSRAVAEQVAEALEEAVPVRRCTQRLGPRTRVAACALAEMGRCLSPCDGSVDPEQYAPAAAAVAAALAGDAAPVLRRLEARVRRLAATQRYEEAAAARDRLAALVTTLIAARGRAALVAAATLVASRPRVGSDAEIAVITAGRLDVEGPLGGHATAAAEADLLMRWLGGRGVRVQHCDGSLAEPVASGRQLAELAARLTAARRGTGRPESELAAKRTRRPNGENVKLS